jgi:succinate dehydrogenase/fumarate reductase cytochrome b subunit
MRPVFSDHILIYRPNESSFFSIVQRITGVILFLFFLLLAGINFTDYSIYYMFHFSMLFSFFLFYFHFFNGLRIFLNDKAISSLSLSPYFLILSKNIDYSKLILIHSILFSLFSYFVITV